MDHQRKYRQIRGGLKSETDTCQCKLLEGLLVPQREKLKAISANQ
jgi:hypothetical protein